MTMRGTPKTRDSKYFDMTRALLRMDDLPAVSTTNPGRPGCGQDAWRMLGMCRAWEAGDAAQLHRRLSNALTGLAAAGESFAFFTVSDGLETSFYLCPAVGREAVVMGAFAGVLEDARFAPKPVQTPSLVKMGCGTFGKTPAYCSGCMRGMPAVPQAGVPYLNPVDAIITGMKGSPFITMTLCMPAPRQSVADMQQVLYRLMDAAAQDQQYSIASTRMDERTVTVTDYSCKRYLTELEQIGEHLTEARDCGGWNVMTLFAAPDVTSARRLSALLSGAYSGPGAGPEPVRCHQTVTRITDAWMPGVLFPNLLQEHPLGVEGSAYTNPVLTPLSSVQLASLLMLPDREAAGFFVNEEARFDLTCRNPAAEDAITLGNILRSPYADDAVGRYPFPQEDFSRHVLVVGATGGGKSNTIRSLLRTLHGEGGLPFMVIESAKSEYWQLSAFPGFENLCVMPLGETDSPFRLNPFECTDGFSLQTHVDALLATFKAAFDMYTPMPFILEQAVYEVYRDYGWDVATGKNDRPEPHQYPSLADLYWQIPETVAGTAYDKEIRDNVTGALQTRVKSLMFGGKGAMLNVRRSTPLDKLLTLPVVLELESLGDDETKAFVMGLLMNRLYEYRRAHSDGTSQPFSHLLIIEEAHRLLKRVSPAENSSSAASVEFFCNMLSEIRSYGQGIMIADQSPMKLAQDAVRNTNLKVVHRMVDHDDRHAVGGAMHMDDHQIEALSMLRRGVGAVYAEGDNRPKLVKFPLVKADRSPNRTAALAKAARVLADTASAVPAGDAGCAGCRFLRATGCGTRMASTTAREVAECALGPDKAAQSADYLQKFSEHGPNPQLVDAIIEYGLRRYTERHGAAPSALDRRCAAGRLATALFSDDRPMAEMIVTRYSNYLARRK